MKKKTQKINFSTLAIKNFILFIIVVSYVMGASICHAEIVKIKVNSKSIVNRERILLGDISDIHGVKSEIKEKISSIDIGSSPRPGETRNISKDNIIIRLKQNGLELSNIKIEISDSCIVTRGFIKVDKNEVERAVIAYIKNSIPWNKEQVVIKNIHANRDVILPKGNISFKIETSKNEDFIGMTPIRVLLMVNGVPERRVLVNTEIAVFTDVVFSKDPIRRNTRITEDELYTKKMDLADLPRDAITNYMDAVGMRAKRNIAPNSVIRHDYIEIPPMIKKGDVVSIIAESNDLRITTMGIAKEKGNHGSRIMVENLSSKKEIYAYIINSKTVKVEF
jgi:flagella basal body P-ring formation protein FlgA